MIRLFRESDRPQLKAITADVLGPAAVDYYLERRFGPIQGRDWAWRKVRHIDDDIRTNAGGSAGGAHRGAGFPHHETPSGLGRLRALRGGRRL